jgi:hypothetical protein
MNIKTLIKETIDNVGAWPVRPEVIDAIEAEIVEPAIEALLREKVTAKVVGKMVTECAIRLESTPPAAAEEKKPARKSAKSPSDNPGSAQS